MSGTASTTSSASGSASASASTSSSATAGTSRDFYPRYWPANPHDIAPQSMTPDFAPLTAQRFTDWVPLAALVRIFPTTRPPAEAAGIDVCPAAFNNDGSLKTALHGFFTIPQVLAILAKPTRTGSNGGLYVMYHPATGKDLGADGAAVGTARDRLVRATRQLFGLPACSDSPKRKATKAERYAAEPERWAKWREEYIETPSGKASIERTKANHKAKDAERKAKGLGSKKQSKSTKAKAAKAQRERTLAVEGRLEPRVD